MFNPSENKKNTKEEGSNENQDSISTSLPSNNELTTARQLYAQRYRLFKQQADSQQQERELQQKQEQETKQLLQKEFQQNQLQKKLVIFLQELNHRMQPLVIFFSSPDYHFPKHDDDIYASSELTNQYHSAVIELNKVINNFSTSFYLWLETFAQTEDKVEKKEGKFNYTEFILDFLDTKQFLLNITQLDSLFTLRRSLPFFLSKLLELKVSLNYVISYINDRNKIRREHDAKILEGINVKDFINQCCSLCSELIKNLNLSLPPIIPMDLHEDTEKDSSIVDSIKEAEKKEEEKEGEKEEEEEEKDKEQIDQFNIDNKYVENDFDIISDEIMLHLFGFLPPNFILTKAPLVSKRFRALSESKELWKEIAGVESKDELKKKLNEIPEFWRMLIKYNLISLKYYFAMIDARKTSMELKSAIIIKLNLLPEDLLKRLGTGYTNECFIYMLLEGMLTKDQIEKFLTIDHGNFNKLVLSIKKNFVLAFQEKLIDFDQALKLIPRQSPLTGNALLATVSDKGLKILRSRVIKVENIVKAQFDAVTLFYSDQFLKGIQDNLFTLETTEKYSHSIWSICFSKFGMQAFQEGLFKLDETQELSFHSLEDLFSENGYLAMKEALLKPKDLKLFEELHFNCRKALFSKTSLTGLREKLFTLLQASKVENFSNVLTESLLDMLRKKLLNFDDIIAIKFTHPSECQYISSEYCIKMLEEKILNPSDLLSISTRIFNVVFSEPVYNALKEGYLDLDFLKTVSHPYSISEKIRQSTSTKLNHS